MNRETLIKGYGAYLPEKILTNKDLETMMDTSDEWITSRTGIKKRHIAADNQKTSDLATHAAQQALEKAGWDADSIDMIIVATTTPDYTFPATATRVQEKLNITDCIAFDVQAVCAGFVHALAVCDAMLKNQHAERALVIGAETFSRLLDWSDRSTCVLFGDGAGAFVLEAQNKVNANTSPNGIMATLLRSDGRDRKSLYIDGGPSKNQRVGKMRMDGKTVFKKAVTRLASISTDILAQKQLTTDAIDWFIPHQANMRIVTALGKKLGIPHDKIAVTIAEHANTPQPHRFRSSLLLIASVTSFNLANSC